MSPQPEPRSRRKKRIQRLKKQVDSGKYKVRSEDLAKALIASPQ